MTHSEYLKQLDTALQNTSFTDNKGVAYSSYDEGMNALVSIFEEIRKKGKKIFFAGNGGSAAVAIHMTADFFKNAGFKTVDMFSGSVITCLANDYDYCEIFSRQIQMKADEGDLVVVISSSGNSENIVKAALTAKQYKAELITFSGFKADNKIHSLGDLNIYVPIAHYGITESIHSLILQETVDFLLST